MATVNKKGMGGKLRDGIERFGPPHKESKAKLMLTVPLRFAWGLDNYRISYIFQAAKKLFGQPEFVTMPQEICERTPDTPAAQPSIRQIQAFKILCFTIGKARILQKVPDSALTSKQNIKKHQCIQDLLRLKVPYCRHVEGLLKRTPQEKSRKRGPNNKGSFCRLMLLQYKNIGV